MDKYNKMKEVMSLRAQRPDWSAHSYKIARNHSTHITRGICLRPRQTVSADSQTSSEVNVGTEPLLTGGVQWQPMALAYRLGVPLVYRERRVVKDGGTAPNYYTAGPLVCIANDELRDRETHANVHTGDIADILTINADFDVNDAHIRALGLDTTADGGVYGAIDIVRLDGRDLHYEDIEALSDYVEYQFPYMKRLPMRNPSWDVIRHTRERWTSHGNPQEFADWWHEWKILRTGSTNDEEEDHGKSEVGRPNEGYDALKCPVVMAPNPSVDFLLSHPEIELYIAPSSNR